LSADGEFAFEPQVLSAWRFTGKMRVKYPDDECAKKLSPRRVGTSLGFTKAQVKDFGLTMFRAAQETYAPQRKGKGNSSHVQRPAWRAFAGRGRKNAGRPCDTGTVLRWRKSRRQANAARQYGSVVDLNQQKKWTPQKAQETQKSKTTEEIFFGEIAAVALLIL